MMNYLKKFDRFCRKHETLVGFIGCTLSLIILKAAGAF